MRGRGGLLLVLFLFLLFSSLVQVSAEVIEEEVLNALEENEEVLVIVILEDEPINKLSVTSLDKKEIREEKKAMIKKVQKNVLDKVKLKETKESLNTQSQEKTEENYDFDLKHQYSLINGFSGKVNKRGLEKLKSDPHVKNIFFNRILHPTLTTSIPQIKANGVWNLSVKGYNITGMGQTVCVIDTGVDTDHSAFTGRILDQYCYCSVSDYGSGGCCPDNTTVDSSAEDGQGHGTHCAGIAAGNHSHLSYQATSEKNANNG